MRIFASFATNWYKLQYWLTHGWVVEGFLCRRSKFCALQKLSHNISQLKRWSMNHSRTFQWVHYNFRDQRFNWCMFSHPWKRFNWIFGNFSLPYFRARFQLIICWFFVPFLAGCILKDFTLSILWVLDAYMTVATFGSSYSDRYVSPALCYMYDVLVDIFLVRMYVLDSIGVNSGQYDTHHTCC
jgi:hypothetical protein